MPAEGLQAEQSKNNENGAADSPVVPDGSADEGTVRARPALSKGQSWLLFAIAVGAITFAFYDPSTYERKLVGGTGDARELYNALRQVSAVHGGSGEHSANVDALIKRLEGRLAANPNDADGWRVLGWSYFKRQDFDKSVVAYRRASEMDPNSAVLKSLLAEAMVAASSGRVTGESLAVFEETLKLDSRNARARYFVGQAKLQDGDVKSALDDWIDLLASAPAGAQWASNLRSRVLSISEQHGIDVSQRLPQVSAAASATAPAVSAAGPTVEDIEKAGSLTPEARESMARDMVERLAARLQTSPFDADGWIMLIRSRVVLGEEDAAKSALKEAMTVFADETDIKERIKLAALSLNVSLDD